MKLWIIVTLMNLVVTLLCVRQIKRSIISTMNHFELQEKDFEKKEELIRETKHFTTIISITLIAIAVFSFSIILGK